MLHRDNIGHMVLGIHMVLAISVGVNFLFIVSEVFVFFCKYFSDSSKTLFPGAQMINPQINQPRPNAPMPPMPNQMWNNQPPHSMSRMPINPSMNPIRNRIQTTITNRGMPNQHHNMQHQSYGPNGFPPNFVSTLF